MTQLIFTESGLKPEKTKIKYLRTKNKGLQEKELKKELI